MDNVPAPAVETVVKRYEALLRMSASQTLQTPQDIAHKLANERHSWFCRNRTILLFFALTARCWRAVRQTLNPVVAKVLKRLQYPLDVILLRARWYCAYPLSLRNLEEMMAERGASVDHSTVHRWAIKLLPVLEKEFRRSKREVGRSWHMDETYSTPSQRSPPIWG
jgi:hypothetical protein